MNEDEIEEDHRQAALTFATVVRPYSENLEDDVGKALYTYGERNLFPDNIDSMSVEQAIMVWRLLEAIRVNGGFPEHLCM